MVQIWQTGVDCPRATIPKLYMWPIFWAICARNGLVLRQNILASRSGPEIPTKRQREKKHTRKILIVCCFFFLFDPHSSSSTTVTLTVSSIKMRISDYTQWLTFTAIKAVTDKTSAVAVTDMLINGLLWHVNGSPPPNVDVVRGTIKDKVRSMRTNDIKMWGEKSK